MQTRFLPLVVVALVSVLLVCHGFSSANVAKRSMKLNVARNYGISKAY